MSTPETSAASFAPAKPDSVRVQQRRVSCDGGKESLGHPKIYLEIGKTDGAACPYCGKRFIYVGDAH